jgi:hypothetical protein
MRRFAVLQVARVALLTVYSAIPLQAQYAKPPETYSVTEVNSMLGVSVTMQVYRDGPKALVDQSYSGQGRGEAGHTRTLYDFESGKSYTWDLVNTSVPCGASTFSGDWGDPFAMSAEINADLAAKRPIALGTDTINGIATKIWKSAASDSKAKLWREEKYGLTIKLEMTGSDGRAHTLIEVKQLSFSQPPAATFVLPAACAQAAKSPRVPTEQERIAAETDDSTDDFANATMPPPSQNSCTVLFRVVNADTMQPITAGFQAALDTHVDLDHPAGYNTGLGADGRATFSGGSLHEVTAQMHNGVLRMENAPPHFDMEIYFGKSGDSSALIYRHCFGAQTTLLLVVKNPAKLSDGADWLWVKSGKFRAQGSQ